MNKERLLMLADLLEGKGVFKGEEPPLKRFDMSNWKCGTAGCACGWAGSHPWFTRMGFKIDHYRDVIMYTPRGHTCTYYGFQAAAKFFNIISTDAEWLFSPKYYESKSRRTVAKRIRNYVKAHTEN